MACEDSGWLEFVVIYMQPTYNENLLADDVFLHMAQLYVGYMGRALPPPGGRPDPDQAVRRAQQIAS